MKVTLENLSPKQASLLQRSQERWGNQVVPAVLEAWLNDREKVLDQLDAQDFRERYEALSDADKASVMATLKPVSKPVNETVVK